MSATASTHVAGQEGHTGRHHAHHFVSGAHEFSTSKLGVWLFLVTEILFFSGLFMAYAMYHYFHPEMFKGAHKMLDMKMGAINTMVLIFSSLTMALSIRAAQLGKKGQTVGLLAVTFICAGIFLVVKYFEYSHKFHLGLLPGKFYFYDGLTEFTNPHIFFGIYFCMTGLHGIHVVLGMIAILWVMVRAAKGEFGPDYFTPIEGVGLYWHLVDLIWIYLFPLLYLVS